MFFSHSQNVFRIVCVLIIDLLYKMEKLTFVYFFVWIVKYKYEYIFWVQ